MKQTPSRGGPGGLMPFQWIYLKTEKGKVTKFKKLIQNVAGEKPVYLDTQLVSESTLQMKEYLVNKGYFHAAMELNIRYKKQKAFVEFIAHPGPLFYIDSISYTVDDLRIEKVVTENKANSLIQTGDVFDSDVLQDERYRLAAILNNNGYYKFGKDFIFYQVDTSRTDERKLDVNLLIKNRDDTSYHNVYLINKITIRPDYSIIDTPPVPSSMINNYEIIYHRNKVHPSVYLKHINLEEGQLFNQAQVNEMISRLSEIGLFKFIDVDFYENKKIATDTTLLDCEIRITLAETQSYGLDLEANTTEENKQLSTSSSTRYYGMAGNISYGNKNLMRRAIQYSLRLGGAVDIPVKNVENQNLLTNFQVDIDNSLYFPTAFLPSFLSFWDHANSSRTAVNFSYFYEKNIDFQQATTNVGLTYQFNYNRKKYFVTPLELSLVRNELQPEFQATLESFKDPLLNSIFETHLLPAFRMGISFNNKGDHSSHFWRVRANVPELAGNVPYLINILAGNKDQLTDSTLMQLFKTPFFQYAKLDLDASYHQIFNQWSSIVGHFVFGMGLPYGNSTYLPFEKRYYVGGANSMRAWSLRGLGPGAYSSASTAKFIQTGELKLETNLEYRFDIVSMLEGALFIDAGNIWTINQDEALVEGEFEWNDFTKEIAVGSGFGLRLNFVYFIFRTDFAFPVVDPSQPLGERWVLPQTSWHDIHGRIGIGYPF